MSTTDDPTAPTTPAARPWWRRWWVSLLFVAVLGVALQLAFDTPAFTTYAALLSGVLVLRIGWFFLQQFATPPPPPPDPGTLRRVRLVYRCPVCGAEVRMTSAAVEDPEPPRHCMEEMELVGGED